MKLGRVVGKGEKALKSFAPVPVKERDEHDEVIGKMRVFFRTAFVFTDVQTEPLPGVEPAPLEPPSVPIDGDSHGHVLEPLASCLVRPGSRCRRRWMGSAAVS